jgi:hypothetical protein
VDALKPDMPVTYTYTKEGDRMVVTKVTLAKPLSSYETKKLPQRRPSRNCSGSNLLAKTETPAGDRGRFHCRASV